MKPLIGITSNFSSDYMTYVKQGMGAIGQEWSLIANDYSDAIIRSGGIPIVIPISEDETYIREQMLKLEEFHLREIIKNCYF